MKTENVVVGVPILIFGGSLFGLILYKIWNETIEIIITDNSIFSKGMMLGLALLITVVLVGGFIWVIAVVFGPGEGEKEEIKSETKITEQ